MQDSENHSNNLTRRDAIKVAGAAITAAAIPITGAALDQSPQGIAGTSEATRNAPATNNSSSNKLTHKRAKTNGINLYYVTAGSGPVVLCMHGWPQNHREFLPVIARLADRFTFIAPDLRGYADSDKPYDGYEPKNIAQDMLGLLEAEPLHAFTSLVMT